MDTSGIFYGTVRVLISVVIGGTILLVVHLLFKRYDNKTERL